MDPLTWVLNCAEVVGFKLTSNVDTNDNNNNNQKKKAVVNNNDNRALIQHSTAKTSEYTFIVHCYHLIFQVYISYLEVLP